jgi:hypothetical protein
MQLYDVIKVFNISDAPEDLRESDDLATLRHRSSDDRSTILSLKVGYYDTAPVGPVNGPSTREITYAEFRLHRWLVEQGAEEGEHVFLRWKQSRAVRPIYSNRWHRTAAQPGSVTTLSRPKPPCE